MLVMVKLDGPEVRSKPRCCGEAERGPNTSEETPKVRAATTSAMALDRHHRLRPLEPLWLHLFLSFHCDGQAHRGTSGSAPAVPRWSHPVVGRATEGIRDPAFRPVTGKTEPLDQYGVVTFSVSVAPWQLSWSDGRVVQLNVTVAVS